MFECQIVFVPLQHETNTHKDMQQNIIINHHITHAQRLACRYGVILVADQWHDIPTTEYLEAIFFDRDDALEYAKTRHFYTGNNYTLIEIPEGGIR